jgi:CHAT domain-containing protein/tetratricopeptide (TPR) repeat protein
MSGNSRDQAREALRLAEGDPGRSVALATQVARRARVERDVATASVAERALGLATLHLEDLDSAMRHLRTAISLGRQAGSPKLAAEARMTFAYALSRRGRSRRGLQEIDGALRELAGVDRARAQAQRGVILHQLDRLDEALAAYRTALRSLRRADDHIWVQRVLSNRAVLYAHRLEFAAAEADLHEAERLCEQLELPLSIAFIQQNLGWVKSLQGDVPAALRYLDLAEQGFRRLGSQLGEVLSDRSELLLSVYLVSEARQVAEQAVLESRRERRQLGLPEARLFLAQAATLDGAPDRALAEAQAAVRELVRQGRREWAALARFVVLRSRVAAGQQAGVGIRQLERSAAALAEAGWAAAALEARLLAAQLAGERGWSDEGRRQLELASRTRSRGPARLRARAWHAEALLRLAKGNRRGAVRAVRAGLRVLDEHQATLGATDLRAFTAGHRVELAELGLRMALADGRPRRVLGWAEQGRASHLLLRPVRPPADPVLARSLAELRATMAQIHEARDSGRSIARLVQRQVALERDVRDHCRRLPGDGDAPLAGLALLDGLATALGGAAMLEFIQLDGRLHVATVIDGQVRLRELGPLAGVRDQVDHLAFALRRLAHHRRDAASRSAAISVIRHTAARFDAFLLRPLAAELDDRPLVLVPTGPLQSLPWSMLPTCRGRPVTVSPSASLWRLASSRPPAAGPVLVAAGPGLPGAQAEVEAVAAIHGTSPLVGPAATVEAVAAALDGAELAHLAAHGHVRADNPLFSSLRLADGPLTIYDLERLERLPDTVVLAACDAGRPVTAAGDELLGLSATFLARGTRQLVASVVPVPDAETAPLMVELHRLLALGNPPAAALERAQRRLFEDEPTTMAAAGAFMCIGAGLTPRAAKPAEA